MINHYDNIFHEIKLFPISRKLLSFFKKSKGRSRYAEIENVHEIYGFDSRVKQMKRSCWLTDVVCPLALV